MIKVSNSAHHVHQNEQCHHCRLHLRIYVIDRCVRVRLQFQKQWNGIVYWILLNKNKTDELTERKGLTPDSWLVEGLCCW
jgi:hypothetical protein